VRVFLGTLKQLHTMTIPTQIEAKSQIEALLEKKFAELVKQGWSYDAAFADVMGAFEQQFPGVLEKL